MSTLLADLVSTLRSEIELYRRMLTLIRRERGRIVKGELAGLVELVQQKEALSQALEAAHVCRCSLLNRLAAAFADEGAALTLTRVAQIAPGEAGITLAALCQEFRTVIGLLVAANDINRTLLARAHECVRGSLDLFRSVSGAPTYGAGGRIAAAPVAVLSRSA